MYRRDRRRKKNFRLDSKDYIPMSETVGKKQNTKRVIRRWFILFLLLLCLIQLVISPKDGSIISAKNPYEGEIDIPDKHYHGEVVTVGAKFPAFKSLKEVPARLASLKGLDVGSEEAQKQQLQLSRTENLPLEVENSVGIKFRLIPSGFFIMGSPADETGRKKYVGKGIDIEEEHREEVSEPFYVSKFEITQAEWKRVMGELPGKDFRLTGDNLPAVEINWYDAVKFCRKLADMEGVPHSRYRLLTEAEWEYVCRAGTKGPYHFSKNKYAKHFTVYNMNSGGCTNVVGTKRPNAWGVYNMHGNVWEWCLDYYRDYFTGKLLDTEDAKQRNIRGGSWYHDLKYCRSANRLRRPPLTVGNMLGFRIIRKIKAEMDELSSAENMEKNNE